MKHPPYHLRPNKAVDRLLLVEAIRLSGSSYRYSDYTYYSLAGPFLEDLRVVDHFFPEMKLVSLESSEHTFARQEFHRFNSQIVLQHRPFQDFIINDYEPRTIEGRDVFWLDYTDLEYTNFSDFQITLRKVPLDSIVRITLRAEPDLNLERLDALLTSDEIQKIKTKTQHDFEEKFHRILPHPTPDSNSSLKIFARTVQLMVRRAASIALDTAGSERDFLPIQSTRYNDGTQMISITGIVHHRSNIKQTRDAFVSLRFADFDWIEPSSINIPSLSAKERMHLERYLPVNPGEDPGDVLFEALKYNIDRSKTETKKQLSNYADYCRDYPNFIRTPV